MNLRPYRTFLRESSDAFVVNKSLFLATRRP